MNDATTQPVWSKLGLIAGGGDLPLEIARAVGSGRLHVISLKGMVDRDFSDFETSEFSVGQFGHVIRALKQAECDAICFAGYVPRPDFKTLRVDAHGVGLLPKVVAAARRGDDALIRVIVGEFEKAGFSVLGADDLLSELVPEAGVIVASESLQAHREDIGKAHDMAARIGALDIGQGVVVARGVVLAVEAQEGTNLMLERVASLPETVRGHAAERAGVLAKCPKPIQERRVDLPTIGVETVRLCARAGLAGIVLEAGGALILHRKKVIEAAEQEGLFLIVEAPL
ncbi:LpxI family protein [Maricaulis sp. CAU 1757]